MFAACAWLIDLAVLRGGTPHPLDDTWEYGLVARSLLAGHGFRTPMIHPPLWGLHDASNTVPVLVHGPLLSLLGAPWLAWFGPGALDGAAWLAAAFAVLTAVFTARAVKHALMAPGPGLGLVAALGLFVAMVAPRTRRWALAALGAALVPLLLGTTTESSERCVAVFLSLWVAGALHAAQAWAGGGGRAHAARIALLLLLLPFTVRAAWLETRRSEALRSWLVTERAALASRSAPGVRGRLLFSDTPDFAAWTTGRPTIATTREDYLAAPAAADPAGGIPPHGTAIDEWFHADVRATPAPTGGGTAAGTTPPGNQPSNTPPAIEPGPGRSPLPNRASRRVRRISRAAAGSRRADLPSRRSRTGRRQRLASWPPRQAPGPRA